MKIYAFDVEVASWEEGSEEVNWESPPEISCAMIADCSINVTTQNPGTFSLAQQVGATVEYEQFAGHPYMNKTRLRALANRLSEIANERDSILVTWNGVGFDLPLLRTLLKGEPYMQRILLEATKKHVDMMYMVVAKYGHYLGLDKALLGSRVPQKVHDVTLLSGERLTGMSGKLAPELWQRGEHEAVLEYLKGDVLSTLILAYAVSLNKDMGWVSSKGRQNNYAFPSGLMTVAECLEADRTVARWMRDPVDHCAFAERALRY